MSTPEKKHAFREVCLQDRAAALQKVRALVGQKWDPAISASLGWSRLRIQRPSCAYTCDYVENRLNIVLDRDDVVVDFGWG